MAEEANMTRRGALHACTLLAAAIGLAGAPRLVADPPCDLAAVKPGTNAEIRNILVPVRGGPHARLATKVAQAVAARHVATVTLLHMTRPDCEPERRASQDELFHDVAREVPEAAVRELIEHGRTSDVGLGIAGAVLGIIGNQAVARYKMSVGKRINSATLIADARHSWLDALSSAAALTCLIAVALGALIRGEGRA